MTREERVEEKGFKSYRFEIHVLKDHSIFCHLAILIGVKSEGQRQEERKEEKKEEKRYEGLLQLHPLFQENLVDHRNREVR